MKTDGWWPLECINSKKICNSMNQNCRTCCWSMSFNVSKMSLFLFISVAGDNWKYAHNTNHLIETHLSLKLLKISFEYFFAFILRLSAIASHKTVSPMFLLKIFQSKTFAVIKSIKVCSEHFLPSISYSRKWIWQSCWKECIKIACVNCWWHVIWYANSDRFQPIFNIDFFSFKTFDFRRWKNSKNFILVITYFDCIFSFWLFNFSSFNQKLAFCINWNLFAFKYYNMRMMA